MFFTNRYDQLDKDNQDLCIQNNELKTNDSQVRIKVTNKTGHKSISLVLGKLLHTNSHNIRLYATIVVELCFLT